MSRGRYWLPYSSANQRTHGGHVSTRTILFQRPSTHATSTQPSSSMGMQYLPLLPIFSCWSYRFHTSGTWNCRGNRRWPSSASLLSEYCKSSRQIRDLPKYRLSNQHLRQRYRCVNCATQLPLASRPHGPGYNMEFCWHWSLVHHWSEHCYYLRYVPFMRGVLVFSLVW